MRSLLVLSLLALASLQAFTAINASFVGCFIQDSQNYEPAETGYFQYDYMPLELENGIATITFYAGDQAYGDYVISTNFGGNQAQSAAFDGTIPTQVTVTFTATGTYWIYLAAIGTTANVAYLQVRVVNWGFVGPIPRQYQNPPFGWSTGYPPASAWLVASDSDTYPNVLGPPSSSSFSASSKVSIWLAPLLVGVVMAALTVPIAMIAYKKGKAAGMGMGMDKEQQQQQQQQQTIECVQVANSA